MQKFTLLIGSIALIVPLYVESRGKSSENERPQQVTNPPFGSALR